jgi:hypothetical protein
VSWIVRFDSIAFFLAELIGLLGVAAIELNQTNVFGVHNQPPVAIRPWSNQIACGHIPMTKRVFVFFLRP